MDSRTGGDIYFTSGTIEAFDTLVKVQSEFGRGAQTSMSQTPSRQRLLLRQYWLKWFYIRGCNLHVRERG